MGEPAGLLGGSILVSCGGFDDLFAALAREHGAGDCCVTAGEEAWFAYDPPPMALDAAIDAALGVLARVAPLALLTSGHPRTQQGKIDRLGLAPRFETLRIVVHRDAGGKTAALAGLIAERRWDPSRVVVCGDRPDGDVRAGNRNGCLTVLVRRKGAEFANVATASPDDVPWRIVGSVTELPLLLGATRSS